MEKKNDNTIFLLIAAGLGVYWLMGKSTPPATTAVSIPTVPQNVPVDQTVISTQPVAQQPVTVAPTPEIVSVSTQAATPTLVSDMLSTITNIPTGGGLQNTAQESAVNIDNINLIPKSAVLVDQYT